MPPRRTRLAVLVGVLVVGADQLTKQFANARLAGGPRPLLGDLLRLHLAHNPGAAFSAGSGLTPLISLVAVAAAVIVVVLAARARSTGWALGLGLLLGGVVGNLIDRVVRPPGFLRGHVVDFLELPHWPIFNVADVGINLAAVVILVQVARGVTLDGRRRGGRPSPDGDGAEGGGDG